MTDFNPQITAMYARRSLTHIQTESTIASTRLSTGLRINDAKDDAAGVTKAAQLSSRIVSLQRAASNASDGIQMLETAEGAARQVGDMLLRMRELSLQSMTDTYSPQQRQDLDVEFQQLKAQLLQVASDTVWNDHHILAPHQDLRTQVEPARVTSTAPINTQGPASGIYDLYLNGTQVSLALTDGENPQDRLSRIVSAINDTRDQHGVTATPSISGGLSLTTPDGRDLSAWYDNAVGGLDASHLGLGQAAQSQITSVTLSPAAPPSGLPTMTVTDSYIEFAGLGEATESIVPSRSATPDTSAGAVSIVGATVYRGDGSQVSIIGRVDAEKDGLDGQPLRIVFGTNFVNGDFETGSAGSSTVPGWQVVNGPVRLNGLSTIAGYPTPTDVTPRGAEPSTVNSNASFSTSLTSDGLQTGSTLGLRMVSSNVSTPAYGVVHGPYIVSESPVILEAGGSVSFDWKAQGGEDDFDVYAYLLNTDTGQTIGLLNQTGSSTNWATVTANVPQAGSYKFVFISGTYDATGGTIAGAQLFVDNIKVNGAQDIQQPTTQDIAALQALVSYSNPRPMSAVIEVQGITIESVSSADISTVTDSLQSRIQAQIDLGNLQNIRIERNNNVLSLVGTVAGTAFEVAASMLSGDSASVQVQNLRASQSAEFLIDGFAGADSSTQGARVFKGQPLTQEAVQEVENKIFHVGEYDGDFIRFKLPNFGPTGDILRSLVWDLAERDESFTDGPLSALMAQSTPQVSADIRAPGSAAAALTAIDAAIARTLEAQTSIGALVNRLDHVLAHLTHTGDNAQAARSQIRDADYAKESARLSKAQLMQEVAMQALAQAQVAPRNILKLLA